MYSKEGAAGAWAGFAQAIKLAAYSRGNVFAASFNSQSTTQLLRLSYCPPTTAC
jgi:hypothetical protein